MEDLLPVEDIPKVGTALDWILKAAIVRKRMRSFAPAQKVAESTARSAQRATKAPKTFGEGLRDSATDAAAQAWSFKTFTAMGGRGGGVARRAAGMFAGSQVAKGIKGALRMGLDGGATRTAEELLEASIMRSQQASKNIARYLKGGKVARRVAVPSALKILNGISFDGSGKRGKTLQEAFKLRSDELAKLVGDPNTVNRVHDSVAEVSGDDLALHDQTGGSVMQRVRVMHQAAPKRTRPAGLASMDDYRPSEKQINDWARVIRAADDPLSLVDDLLAERVSYRAVQAVKEAAPETWTEIRGMTMEAVAEHRGKIPYRTKAYLSLYLEATLHPSFAGDRVKTAQARHTINEEQQGQKPRPKLASIKAPEPTQAQRLQE